ncbi:hypothetical protein [Cerasicoccus maritimus]|uniref:hypothetical protein n=1 Tax=Cerasicoccus maritimus TaxID=490089 RepID=UPI0028526E48|nr:hypothetical protein [Cerasicoccus maritimus]
MKTLAKLVCLICATATAFGLSPNGEKLEFLRNNPHLAGYVESFAATSPEREILAQVVFDFQAKAIRQNTDAEEAEIRVKALKQYYISEREKWNKLSEEMPSDSCLFLVNFWSPELKKQWYGYLLLENGKPIWREGGPIAVDEAFDIN